MNRQWGNAINYFEVRYPGQNYIVNHLLFAKDKVKTTEKIFNFLSEKHKLNKDSRVLEIGCGMGRNLREARKKFGCHVTGFDINKNFIQMNKDFFKENCFFEVSDFGKDVSLLSQYEANHFDFGISYAFLMCIPPSAQKTKLIHEFLRICKTAYIYEYYSISKEEVKVNGLYDKNGDCITVLDDYRKYDKRIKIEHFFDIQHSDLVLFIYEQ
jgi:ubiquinone/menaquinone biosynthesis C-methylase UbiE